MMDQMLAVGEISEQLDLPFTEKGKIEKRHFEDTLGAQFWTSVFEIPIRHSNRALIIGICSLEKGLG